MIAATYTDCVQRGLDYWVNKPITKVFPESASFADVFAWARSAGMADIKLSDLVFSEVVE